MKPFSPEAMKAASDFLGLGAVYLTALGLAFGQVWAGAGLAAGCLAWCLWRART